MQLPCQDALGILVKVEPEASFTKSPATCMVALTAWGEDGHCHTPLQDTVEHAHQPCPSPPCTQPPLKWSGQCHWDRLWGRLGRAQGARGRKMGIRESVLEGRKVVRDAAHENQDPKPPAHGSCAMDLTSKMVNHSEFQDSNQRAFALKHGPF